MNLPIPAREGYIIVAVMYLTYCFDVFKDISGKGFCKKHGAIVLYHKLKLIFQKNDVKIADLSFFLGAKCNIDEKKAIDDKGMAVLVISVR
jgi:hypothetical protein